MFPVLPKVSVGRHSGATLLDIDSYRPLVGDELIDEVVSLARALASVRVCHLNSTSFGGGVAELLARTVPLMNALGLQVDWRLLHARPEFFAITKSLHNALQGAPHTLSYDELEVYFEVNRESAALLETDYDVIVVHDPQPAAVRHFSRARARWIWRCHIDTSAPNPEVAGFLKPLLEEYDALVFTLREFLLPDLAAERVDFIAPAIDPLATKNMDLPLYLCKQAIADAGIDVRRPLLLQVSRFDPWKDPLGVIQTYRLVKQEVPEVQLALIGAIAGDDPEGWHLLERVQEAVAADRDLFVFTNLGGVGSMEVNVFQRGCDVVIQKSMREGFGLVVSEALWKEKPVVAGRAGGIPIQFPPGYGDYLVTSVEACAARLLDLLRKPGFRAEFGRAGREHVRRHFLLPRLVRDELRLVADILGQP